MKNIICGIYCIENIENNKKYIGKSKDIMRRFISHRSDLHRNRNKSSHLQKAFSLYGESAFSFYVIEECDISKLDEREIYYISILKTTDRNFGYNILDGGNSPPDFTGKKHSEETKKKMSESSKGKPGTWTGRKHTQEEKDKISKANKGKILSDKTISLIKEAKKGKQLGDKNPFYGKSHSEETKLKISYKNTGRVVSIEEREKRRKSSIGKGVGRKRKNSTSTYIGVGFHKLTKKWQASIGINFEKKGKIYLGLFNSEVETAKAYDKKSYELYGNNRPLNFPQDYE